MTRLILGPVLVILLGMACELATPHERDVPGVYLANHDDGVDVLVLDTTGWYTHMGQVWGREVSIYSNEWYLDTTRWRVDLKDYFPVYQGSPLLSGRGSWGVPLSFSRGGEVRISIDDDISIYYGRVGGLDIDARGLFDSLMTPEM